MDKMFLISFGVIIVIISKGACMSVRDTYYRRDYTYYENANGWLKLHTIPSNWKDAVLKCHNEGAILASPINGMDVALTAIMNDHGLRTAKLFTGISNIYATSEYQSMEGIPISNIFLSWAGEPNINDFEEECVTMNANGTASAVLCWESHPFVCHRKKGFGRLTECGTVDPEYVLYNETGSCYKVSREMVSWTTAFQSCAMEGGHLAVINGPEEAGVVLELARKSGNNYIWIGFRAWGKQQTWITIHGKSLEDAGYSEWAEGEPNHDFKNCGSVQSSSTKREGDGALNDASCDDAMKYICEIPLPPGNDDI